MTSKRRAFLSGLAINISPSVHIGKAGLTQDVTRAADEAFNTKEIIKLSVIQNCPENPRQIADIVAERTGSEVVQVIGRKIILYKEANKSRKRIIFH